MANKKAPPTVKAIPPERQYDAHNALRTLAQAEQIKNDPKLMADVGALMGALKTATRGKVPK
jgi:hypothetical protein